MSKWILSAVLLLLTNSSLLAAPNVELLERCSVKDPKTGASYIPEKNFPALARLLTDDFLAQNTEGCSASMSAAERAKYEAAHQNAANRRLADLKEIQKQNANVTQTPSVATEAVRSTLRIEQPDTPLPFPLIVRDAYNVTSLNALVAAKNSADGVTFNYIRDFQNDNVQTSLSGSVYALRDIFPEPKDAEAIKPFTRAKFAPGIEFDQERNRSNSKKNIDYLSPRMFAELLLPGGAFLHLFRFGGYLKTDSKGDSKIWGGYAEWQPVSNVYAISSGHPIYPNAPIAFRFDPILHLESENVSAAGALTNVAEGDRYFRAGPILQANLWFLRGPEMLKNLTFSAQYRQLWGTANSGMQKDLRYWQTHLAYNLDAQGHAAINMTYRQGDLPGTGQETRDFRTGLTVKY